MYMFTLYNFQCLICICNFFHFSPLGTKAEDVFRNGVETSTAAYTKPKNNENENQMKARRNANSNVRRVLQEPWAWYDKCYIRERNKGQRKAILLIH